MNKSLWMGFALLLFVAPVFAAEGFCPAPAALSSPAAQPEPVFLSSTSAADIGCCDTGADACFETCSRGCGVQSYQCVRITATACVPICVCRTCRAT